MIRVYIGILWAGDNTMAVSFDNTITDNFAELPISLKLIIRRAGAVIPTNIVMTKLAAVSILFKAFIGILSSEVSPEARCCF
jgi:hypothetical protein